MKIICCLLLLLPISLLAHTMDSPPDLQLQINGADSRVRSLEQVVKTFVNNKHKQVIDYPFGYQPVVADNFPSKHLAHRFYCVPTVQTLTPATVGCDAKYRDWSLAARIIDALIHHHGVLWTVSAGMTPVANDYLNYRLNQPGEAYNALTVAQLEHYDSPTAAPLSSRQGPTVAGRRKPDLSARLGSAEVAKLITSLYSQGVVDNLQIKALIINSATTFADSAPGFAGDLKRSHQALTSSYWDRSYGWGILNAKRALAQKNNVLTGTVSLTSTSNFKLYRHIPSTQAIANNKVTASWLRHVDINGHSAESLPLTPLTLSWYENGRLQGSDHSQRDRFELVRNNVLQLSNSNNTVGDSVIKVAMQKNVSWKVNNGVEHFALASSRLLVPAQGPKLSLSLAANDRLEITNDGDLIAYQPKLYDCTGKLLFLVAKQLAPQVVLVIPSRNFKPPLVLRSKSYGEIFSSTLGRCA